ncbi:GMC oxidoreductase [Apiospora arundinis]
MSSVTLPSKPDAAVAYELLPGDAASTLLIVFLNGLGLPQSVWKPSIELFQQQQQSSTVSPKPWMLTYDRYGQGASSRDPRESWPSKDPGYAHTLDEATDDLHELIQTLSPDRQSRIVFVNNSIGAQIARRYADRYPTIVEGILFLDSNPGNTDYKTIWPNPADPSFDLAQMTPAGTTLELYQAAYTTMTTLFAHSAKNPEGFDRRDIKRLMADPSRPKLRGSKSQTSPERGPWITVVGHELEHFSREEWEQLKVPVGMAAMYTQPMWHKYNEGLCGLTDPDRAKGPLIAPKAGHFIQRDNPAFVAKELQELVENVEGSA